MWSSAANLIEMPSIRRPGLYIQILSQLDDEHDKRGWKPAHTKWGKSTELYLNKIGAARMSFPITDEITK